MRDWLYAPSTHRLLDKWAWVGFWTSLGLFVGVMALDWINRRLK